MDSKSGDGIITSTVITMEFCSLNLWFSSSWYISYVIVVPSFLLRVKLGHKILFKKLRLQSERIRHDAMKRQMKGKGLIKQTKYVIVSVKLGT